MDSWLIAAECVAIWTNAQQTHIFVIPMHFVQILVVSIIAHVKMDMKEMARFVMTETSATLVKKHVRQKMVFMKACVSEISRFS